MNYKITFSVIFCLAISIVPATGASLQDLNTEKEPFVFYTSKESPVGAVVEKRLQEVFRRAGRFTLKFVSFESSQRALVMANEKGDGVPERAQNIKQIAPLDTENLIQIPESIGVSTLNVYTKGVVFSINGYKSLENLRNGFRVGIKNLETNMLGEITMLPGLKRLFQMLDDGRLDTVVALNDSIVDKIIKENHFSGITRLSPPLGVFPTFCLIHKKHEALIPNIVKALKDIKADGTFLQIEKDILKITAQ